MCKEELNQQGIINVDKWLAKGFSQWFKTHVRYLAFDQFTRNFPCVLFTLVLFVQIGKLHEKNNVSDDLFVLACEPDKRVRLYSACIVDGVRYHTVLTARKIESHRIVEFLPRENMKALTSTSMVSSKAS